MVSTARLPASGAWREGDDPGDRRFVDLGRVDLDLGGTLPSVRVAYESWGTLAPDRSNAILVLHALTGDSHVVGPATDAHPTPGWWDGLVGPDGPIDPERCYVVAPNILGGCQGTTGPSSLAPDSRPYGSRFPRITVADQVRVEYALAAALGIDAFAAVLGGSMGGMRALYWASRHPDHVRSAFVIGVGAAATADQIGTQSTQITAITADPAWAGGDYHGAGPGNGPTAGMGVARRIAHLTYRSEAELQARFANDAQEGENPLVAGRFAVQSYLDHHADKLARRFDAGTYVTLTDAMNTWDLGRGWPGGTVRALRALAQPLVVAGIDSDRLYPLGLQRQIADLAPGADGLRVVESLNGHDGFLIEHEQVFALVAETLDRAAVAVRRTVIA